MITHALDLPPLHSRPAAASLLAILSSLTLAQPSWDTSDDGNDSDGFLVIPGTEKWLTSIIASPLAWLDADTQDAVRDAAAARLAERCGRTACPEVVRTFRVPRRVCSKGASDPVNSGDSVNSSAGSSGVSTPALTDSSPDLKLELGSLEPELEDVLITLHEPSLTADNLGLKTWGSAYALARILHALPLSLPAGTRALELGAGTGLVGLAAACVIPELRSVLLTDLPEIVPNLARNVAANETPEGVEVGAEVLDWAEDAEEDGGAGEGEKWGLVLAADPLYSPEHPKLLVGVLRRVLGRGGVAVVALPEREGYGGEREEFRNRMEQAGLVERRGGSVEGRDDWGVFGCRWGIWGWRGEDDGIEVGA
ncbi:putative methyltransferase-domain-containing protein [Geopyxis carbonaria]|nr:putative methyltransferase-domain-containing protein [Geopyxis carbonaria]